MESEIVVVLWVMKWNEDWFIGGLNMKGEFVIEEVVDMYYGCGMGDEMFNGLNGKEN